MKIRTSFVTNSSSSSFVITRKDVTVDQVNDWLQVHNMAATAYAPESQLRNQYSPDYWHVCEIWDELYRHYLFNHNVDCFSKEVQHKVDNFISFVQSNGLEPAKDSSEYKDFADNICKICQKYKLNLSKNCCVKNGLDDMDEQLRQGTVYICSHDDNSLDGDEMTLICKTWSVKPPFSHFHFG